MSVLKENRYFQSGEAIVKIVLSPSEMGSTPFRSKLFPYRVDLLLEKQMVMPKPQKLSPLWKDGGKLSVYPFTFILLDKVSIQKMFLATF